MSAAVNFIIQSPALVDEVEVAIFKCMDCDGLDMPSVETDSHAHRVHKSPTVRVFQKASDYLLWVEEQERYKLEAAAS